MKWIEKLLIDKALAVWVKLSKKYTEQASGEVYVFAENSRPSSIFNQIELPTLKSNTNVIDIILDRR